MNLILLPGMDGTGDMFESFLSVLPESLDPIVVSYPVSEELGYGELAAIARQAIPVGQPYVLLGESFSGPIAIELASDPDNQPAALLLCCSFVRNPSRTLVALRPILPLLPVKNVLVDFAAKYLLGADTADLVDQLRTSLNKVGARVIRQRLREVLAVDAVPALRKVSVPIQYLQASEDRLVPYLSAQIVCDVAPSTEVFRIEGPHLLLQTRPQQAVDAIVGFLETRVVK